MTILERKHPKRWGRQMRAELTGKDGEPLVPPSPLTIKLPEGTVIRATKLRGNGHKADEEIQAR